MTRENYIYVERVSSRGYWRRSTKGVKLDQGPIREGVNCSLCAKYPCFDGIENMKSNLAVTCHQFKKL